MVAFTVGNGEIVFLGWDWFNSDPPNAGQNGGWQGVLGRALTEVAGTGCNITGSPASTRSTAPSRGDRTARGAATT